MASWQASEADIAGLSSRARHGHDAEAQYRLGVINQGAGYFAFAANWYGTALKTNGAHARAAFHLAFLTREGLGIAPNFKTAVALFTQAGKYGLSEGYLEAAKILITREKYDDALKLLPKARKVESENAGESERLEAILLIRDPKTTFANRIRAQELLEIAADKNNGVAQFHLAQLYAQDGEYLRDAAVMFARAARNRVPGALDHLHQLQETLGYNTHNFQTQPIATPLYLN